MNLPKNKLSKEQILDLISKLKKNPNDKYQILTDFGIASAGAGGAGAVATVIGTSVAPVGWGITTLTGAVIVTAAPVALVVGAAVVGGAVAYGITQTVRSQSRRDGKVEQMIEQLEELLRDKSYQETKNQTSEADKIKFILYLEKPLKLNLISFDDASDLIQLVESGQISLFEAYKLVKDILKEFYESNQNTQSTVSVA